MLHLAWNALLHRSHRAHGSLCVACKIMMVDSAKSSKSLSTRSHLHAHDGEHIQDQRWHRPLLWPRRLARPRASHLLTRPNSLPRSGGRSSSWWGTKRGEEKKRRRRGRLPTSREALKLTGELEDAWHLYAVTGCTTSCVQKPRARAAETLFSTS